MKIIDRYILAKFLKTFFFVVLLLVSIICVIDYSEKTDDFIKHNLSFGTIVFDFYFKFIPFMANIMSPICVFITTEFMTARLAAHTEIVAMLAGGISFPRLMFPYFMGSSILGIITFFMVGWIIPNTAKDKVAFEVAYIKNPFRFDDRNIHFRINDSLYVYMESYNNRIHTGYKFTMEKIIGSELKEKLSSDKIQWDSVAMKWHIEKYQLQRFHPFAERIIKGNKLDTAFSLVPKYFESNYKLHETMTFNELDSYIQEQKKLGVGNIESFLSEKYERYAYPFAIIILTMMGVIVSARKSRQGTGLQIAIGFFLAFIYILFVVLSRSVAASGSLSPMLAAWLPNITFFCISTILYFTVPR